MAPVIDDDESGFIILICFGTSGAVSPLATGDIEIDGGVVPMTMGSSLGETRAVDDVGVNSRMAGGDVDCC